MPDLVRRRQVFYIAGYDPQGVAGYHGLFGRELARFAKVWSVKTELSAPATDPDGIAARWDVETSGPNWRVATAYEMLRWDDIVEADLAQPQRRRWPRAVALYLNNGVNGVIARLFGASWRFAVFYLYPAIALLLLAALSLFFAWYAGRGALAVVPSLPLAILAGALVLALTCWLGTKLAHKWYVFHLTDAWLWVDDWVKGRKPEFTDRLDILARRIVAGARASKVDEIVVVGHSGGAAVCVPLVARALELDPDLARHVPRLTVLALGTLIPLLAFYPAGAPFRAAIRRLATEPNLTYIDCQARKDIMNIYGCDPCAVVGLRGPARPRALVWMLRFRDMLAPAFYAKLRWNFFRMHFQFIMAGDRRAPYEYFMFVCGPAPVADWAARRDEMVKAFAPDGTFLRAAVPAKP
jgi:pimeloyl-ACP methyl ester carboxylesterase